MVANMISELKPISRASQKLTTGNDSGLRKLHENQHTVSTERKIFILVQV